MSNEGCGVLFSPCGQILISGSWTGEILLRDISTGEVVLSEMREGEMITSLSCTADRKTFSYVRQPKAVGRGALPPSIIIVRDWPFLMNDEKIIEGNWQNVQAAALSNSAKQIAVLHQLPDAMLRVDVVNRETREIRSVAPFSYGGTNFSITWPHDDRYLAYVGNREIVVLDSNTLEVVVAYEDQFPCFVGFSPSDEYLALGSWTQGTVVSTAVWRR